MPFIKFKSDPISILSFQVAVVILIKSSAFPLLDRFDCTTLLARFLSS
jgi:hypothetical protein